VRFSKPIYESLPWAYMGGGLLALGAGYRLRTGFIATLVSLIGLAAVVGGGAIYLRRRDFRASRSDYDGRDQE
jgi:hypothetical protein